MTTVEYPIPSGFAAAGIVSGPEGLLWFAKDGTSGSPPSTTHFGAIGTINPATKAITEYPIPYAGSEPAGIVWGPDGDLWFTDYGTNSIGQLDPSNHAIVEYPALTASSGPLGIAVVGKEIWFTEYSVGQLGVIDPVTHKITQYLTGGSPTSLAAGADGNLYFTSSRLDSGGIGQFNTTTHATTFFGFSGIPTSQVAPGPDGGLYFGTAVLFRDDLYQRPTIQEIGPTRTFPLYDTSQPPPLAGGATGGLAAGTDGKLYFTASSTFFYSGEGSPITDQGVTEIDSLDPATGAVTKSQPFAGGGSIFPSITAGPDGNLWFTAGAYIGVATIIPAGQSVIAGTTVLANSAGRALPRQLVFVDLNHDGTLDPGDPSTVSGLDGSFLITGVPVGTYNVKVVPYPGSTTAPVSVTTTSGGEATNVVLASHVTSTLMPITYGPAPFGSNNPFLITAEITGLYNILLGHAPDAAGLSGWVNAVVQGLPFSTVVNDFLHGTPYYQRVVASDYQAFDDRAPTTSESDAWVALLQQGYTTEQVAYLMLTSDGFNSLHATDASFIQALYNDLLGRQATDSEVAAWAPYLAATSRAASWRCSSTTCQPSSAPPPASSTRSGTSTPTRRRSRTSSRRSRPG